MRAIQMLRACARVPWFGALALESRASPADGGGALAERAAWLASNALAAGGYWVRCEREVAAAVDRARAVCVDGADPRVFTVLAALAAIPALPLGPSLPLATRAMLRVLGIPMVDAMDPDGPRALIGDAAFADGPLVHVAVRPDATGYVVAVARDHRRLAGASS